MNRNSTVRLSGSIVWMVLLSHLALVGLYFIKSTQNVRLYTVAAFKTHTPRLCVKGCTVAQEVEQVVHNQVGGWIPCSSSLHVQMSFVQDASYDHETW